MCSEEACKVCKWKESCANNQEKPPCYKPKEETAPVNPYVPVIPYVPVPIYPPYDPPWINPWTIPQITWTISTDKITYTDATTDTFPIQ